MFIADDGWITDDGGERSVAFESAFDGCGAADYRLVPLDGGETGVVMRGIFDESVERDEGSKATRRKPRVILFAWPREARAGTRVIIRGREFAVTSFEADANLGTVGWLR
jgi:hypothetical protein